MRAARSLTAGLVLALASFGGMNSMAEPAGASTTWNYMQWNTAGWTKNLGNGVDVAQLVGYIIERFNAGAGPMAVSLQEVCNGPTYSQVDYLRSNLTALGYTTTFLILQNPTKASVDQDKCAQYGNVIITYGPGAVLSQDQYIFSPNPIPPAHLNDWEPRGMICAYRGRPGGNHSACSSHSENVEKLTWPDGTKYRPYPAPSPTPDQMVEGAGSSFGYESIAPGAGHYWGADLNVCYREASTHPNTPYWIYYEANGQPTPPPAPSAPNEGCSAVGGQPLYTSPVGNLARKIDYAFGSVYRFSSSGYERKIFPSHQSDHALLRSYFVGP